MAFDPVFSTLFVTSRISLAVVIALPYFSTISSALFTDCYESVCSRSQESRSCNCNAKNYIRYVRWFE
jgi:hypothetical protein